MRIQTLLGIEFPIIQGGMANVATGSFAAAVSNAGALGLIGAGGMTGQMLKKEIEICKSLTKKPFGVNLMLMNPQVDEMAQLVAKERVPVVTTGAGNPASYIEMWKNAGIKIFPVVSAVALAKRLEAQGVDGVIAEGCEAGGHIGEATTMALIPQITRALNIPVIAAGGIAVGEQMLAAFALGACGVQVGTCLLVSKECPIHENYKAAVLRANDRDTVVTGRIAGTPVRILKNKMAREYVLLEKIGTDKMELEKFTLGSLRRAVLDGDTETGSLMAGQCAGLCNEIRPLREIFEALMRGCEHTLARLNEATEEKSCS